MAKQLKKEIGVKNDFCQFYVPTRSGITVISGNGASGKTLLFNLRSGLKGAGVPVLRNEYFLNSQQMRNMGTSFEEFISGHKSAVIWVDNADIVVPRSIKIKEKIAKSSCQFVFLGRDIDRYTYDYADVVTLTEVSPRVFKAELAFPEGASLWG